MTDETFDTDLILAIFKLVWSRRAETSDEKDEAINVEVGASTSKKNRGTTANASSLKVSCELLRFFVTEAVQRAAILAEAEGSDKIEATHLERVLPQLLLDF
ncbi:centromere protein X isoform X1 [Ananas comosus]|uniref:Centromere protein X isoform X1 n=2 Tax=Ananas comosus TaxID=4615 RepID=A0A6P5GTP6_ANACO|nr:centromere protein X isoform X1 [Ananas comosus]XP_020111274.1 centromere protein X isoform X1 [Ananas comosus]XP_020111275.1 centromere protein X isoform X1 [Ananas comosus]XP_020111276.1 centromere protein X isoform X1 [Ananas comosus]